MLSKEKLAKWAATETDDTKTCTRCGKVKPLYNFGFHANGRKLSQTYCLKCRSKKSKEQQIFDIHGITMAQYDAMLEKQGGVCKICGTNTPGGRGRYHVDHCHKTGKIRGLLCNRCNIGLGQFKDNSKILTAAAHYLNESKHG